MVEVHDATSPSEIMSLIQLGICRGEDAPAWIDEGFLEINGKVASILLADLLQKVTRLVLQVADKFMK